MRKSITKQEVLNIATPLHCTSTFYLSRKTNVRIPFGLVVNRPLDIQRDCCHNTYNIVNMTLMFTCGAWLSESAGIGVNPKSSVSLKPQCSLSVVVIQQLLYKMLQVCGSHTQNKSVQSSLYPGFLLRHSCIQIIYIADAQACTQEKYTLKQRNPESASASMKQTNQTHTYYHTAGQDTIFSHIYFYLRGRSH